MPGIEIRVESLLQAALTEGTDVAFWRGHLISVGLNVPCRVEGDWVDLTAAELTCQDKGGITSHYTDAAEVTLE